MAKNKAYSKAELALLKQVDAYETLAYSVGGEYEDGGDWSAFADYAIGKIGGKRMVAYHVVVDSDSGGFVQEVESGVVECSKAPKNLLDRYMDIAYEQGTLTEESYAESLKSIEQFEKDLQKACKAR